jgi:serine/threonine-protein kinase HipA
MEIDIHLQGAWHPCAQVELPDETQGSRHSPVRLRYEADYAVEHLGARDFRALTVRAPVDLGTRNLPRWPSFLVDLLPQGAARKRIERTENAALTEWALLQRGAVNPVGNLRVRPSEPRAPRQHAGFDLRDMASRGDEFVDQAHELGATVAGATDTQGEAPKFWVVEDSSGRWHPDSGALAFAPRRYALLKFPVPEAGPRAATILRHEAAYQRVAQRLGLRVTPVLPEAVGEALLIPRFDRRQANGVEVRLGVESLYSISGVLDSGLTHLTHHECLIALARCVTDFETELTEYVRRDILNLALGNRDNHGRNTAVLKETDGSIRLAPLYDFGPAFLDARALARVMRWDGEEAGRRDWNRILSNLETHFEEAEVAFDGWSRLRRHMRAFADQARALPQTMQDCGVDAAIIEQRREEIARVAAELRAIAEEG